MPERNSRSRIRSSQSLPRLSSTGSFNSQNKETVYFICGVRAAARKTLKPKEQISQEGVERFVRKGHRVRLNHFELYFLEDRIRFKPDHVGLRTHFHPTVAYKQIKGAFSIIEKPNWLILGLLYPEKNQRKLESFYFQTSEEADRVKELLLMVKNNTEGRLQGAQPIGFVSTGSTRSLSRPSSVEYHLVDQESKTSTGTSPIQKYLKEQLTPGAEDEEHRALYLHSQGTSPIIQPFVLCDSPMEEEIVTKYKPVNKEISRARKLAPMHLYEEREISVSQWRVEGDNDGLFRRSSHTLYALASEAPGSLIFINNTPSKGVHVSEDGPVYMFCQVEQ